MDYRNAINTPLNDILYKENNLSYDEVMSILYQKKPYIPQPKTLLIEFIDEIDIQVFDCLSSLKTLYPDIKLTYSKLLTILEKTIKVEEYLDDEDDTYDDTYDDVEYWILDKVD